LSILHIGLVRVKLCNILDMFVQTALEAFEAWHEEKNGVLDEAISRAEQLEEQLQQLQEELAAEQEPRCGCGLGACTTSTSAHRPTNTDTAVFTCAAMNTAYATSRAVDMVLTYVCRREAQQQAEQLQAKLLELTAQLEGKQATHNVRRVLSVQGQLQDPASASFGHACSPRSSTSAQARLAWLCMHCSSELTRNSRCADWRRKHIRACGLR
jgi:hypothetical protein